LVNFMGLLALLIIPVLAMLAIALRAPARGTALVASLLNLGVVLGLWLSYNPVIGGYQHGLDVPWIRLGELVQIRFHLGVDGLSLPLLLLTTLVTLAAVLVTPETVKRPAEFFSYVLMISMGALGAFVSLDLFFLYIFHEFALIPTFLLIGIWGSQGRQFASMQMTLYLTLGSMILLAGLLALVFALPPALRTFDLPAVVQAYRVQPVSAGTQTTIFGLLLVGFGILVSLVPFHTWAAPGYASAPPAAAMLHAGVLKKFGLYGLIRIALPLLPQGLHTPVSIPGCAGLSVTWEHILGLCLVGNILYAGLVALAQKELGLMLGFSSVMHMGYIFLGLLAGNVISVSGAVVLMVGHGLSAALLFGLAGEVQRLTGETQMSQLGGLAKRAPFLGVAFVMASMASVGLPGLANFPGELLVFFGSWHSWPLLTVIALWGVVLSSVYQLRAVRRVCFAELPEKFENVSDLTFSQRLPYVLLLAASLLIGFMPSLLLNLIQPAVKVLLGGGQ
jgi:NADH-quinone oxidoreductase subunit M